MAQKAVPEYMKRYMENIGEDCFPDYDLLSQQYHKSVQVYHEMRFPSRIPLRGGPTFKQDVSADLQRIDAQFKARSLDIACEKYGYKDPGYENYDKDLTGMQEGGGYNNLSKDDFGLSAEDIRAKKAHAVFEKENPDKMLYKEGNRSVIDYYYSGPDGPSERKPESPSKAVESKDQEKTIKKEPLSPEELSQAYGLNKKDIAGTKKMSMSDRFFMSLPSDTKTPEAPGNPALHDRSKGKGDIEMERDI